MTAVWAAATKGRARLAIRCVHTSPRRRCPEQVEGSPPEPAGDPVLGESTALCAATDVAGPVAAGPVQIPSFHRISHRSGRPSRNCNTPDTIRCAPGMFRFRRFPPQQMPASGGSCHAANPFRSPKSRMLGRSADKIRNGRNPRIARISALLIRRFSLRGNLANSALSAMMPTDLVRQLWPRLATCLSPAPRYLFTL